MRSALSLQGQRGDINPYYAVVPLKEDAIKRRDSWTGQRLGEEAAQWLVGIHSQAEKNRASIRGRFAAVSLPL